MTRVVSLILLLVAAFGASSELALAAEMYEVPVETHGTDVLPTPEIDEVEVSDEVVFTTRMILVIETPFAMDVLDLHSESVLDVPKTRPPRI